MNQISSFFPYPIIFHFLPPPNQHQEKQNRLKIRCITKEIFIIFHSKSTNHMIGQIHGKNKITETKNSIQHENHHFRFLVKVNTFSLVIVDGVSYFHTSKSLIAPPPHHFTHPFITKHYI